MSKAYIRGACKYIRDRYTWVFAIHKRIEIFKNSVLIAAFQESLLYTIIQTYCVFAPKCGLKSCRFTC